MSDTSTAAWSGAVTAAIAENSGGCRDKPGEHDRGKKDVRAESLVSLCVGLRQLQFRRLGFGCPLQSFSGYGAADRCAVLGQCAYGVHDAPAHVSVLAADGAFGGLLELGDDLLPRPVGVLGAYEGGDGGDVGGGEARSVVGAVAAAGHGGDDVDAGCGDADEVASLGEERAFVVAVGGGDREDAVVRGRVGVLGVAVSAVVSGGGDDDDVVGQRLADGAGEGGARDGLALGVLADVDDVDVGGHRVFDGLGEGLDVALLVPVVLADGDDRRLGGESDEAGALGRAGGDDAGDLRTVPDEVDGGALGEAAGIVVLAGLEEVLAEGGVDGRPQLLVLDVDAAVDHRDSDALALGLLPQLVELDAL